MRFWFLPFRDLESNFLVMTFAMAIVMTIGFFNMRTASFLLRYSYNYWLGIFGGVKLYAGFG